MSPLATLLAASAVAAVTACTPEAGCQAAAPAVADRRYVQRLAAVQPNAVYPEACNSSVTFNDPGSWSHGNASMTVALVRINCAGVSRQLHWHPEADEWGYVVRGEVITYVASPDGLPWPVSTNRLGVHGVWYFPRGWLHGFTCASQDGCEVLLSFNTRVSVPVDNHNLDSTLAQAEQGVAAEALGLTPEAYNAALPTFAQSAAPDAFKSPLLILVPGLCEPRCPDVQETTAMPAAANLQRDGRKVTLPGGAQARDMRTAQFPFAKTLSQELVRLEPGRFRGVNWVTNANALLVVTMGAIEAQLQGGVTDATAHEAFTLTLRPGDALFIPIGRGYWLREASGKDSAAAVLTFDTGDWQTAELGQSLRALPSWTVAASLRDAPLSGRLALAAETASELAAGSATTLGGPGPQKALRAWLTVALAAAVAAAAGAATLALAFRPRIPEGSAPLLAP